MEFGVAYTVYAYFYINFFKSSTLKWNWTEKIKEIPKKDQVEYINQFSYIFWRK